MVAERLTLRRIHVHGSPTQMGEAHGEELRASIQGFVRQRMDALRQYMQERNDYRVDEFLRIGARCLAIAAEWDPAGTEEQRAIARAAGVDEVELYAVANMTDVRDVLL